MNRGISLHIGVNKIDSKSYARQYDRSFKELKSCHWDAEAMRKIAESFNYEYKILVDANATRVAVLNEIYRAANTLQAGDKYFLSYAGHGSQLPDIEGGDESDGYDETWCMYDAQILDDELAVAFSAFKEDVRILLISDSCHSGTVSRGEHGLNPMLVSPEGIGFRCLNPSESYRSYLANREFYDGIKANVPNPLPEIRASVKSITACKDNELASDGKKNGFFTTNLLKVWKDGDFQGDYDSLFKKLDRKMSIQRFWNGKNQHPTFIPENPRNPNFLEPFRI